jgi:YfiH family protein
MTEINYTSFLGVTAFTSTAELDFLKGDPSFPNYVLNAAQRDYLKARGIPAEKGVVVPKQVHGDVIWKVTARDIPSAGLVEADAVVTDVRGVPVAIRTADCLPALLYDPVRGVIAAVHAGWKSTRLDIAAKTVRLMAAEYGVDPKDIRAAIGPCISRGNCEVGSEFREYFPQDTIETQTGLRFDIVSANRRQLTGVGVLPGHILESGLCSFADAARFHSFRRDADRSGRMISVIMMAEGV